jgi:starch phosphorylase
VPYRGAADLSRLAAELASGIPAELAPLAKLAANYRWSWMQGAAGLFRSIDPSGFHASGENPVRLLREAAPAVLERAAGEADLVAGARSLAGELDDELSAPAAESGLDPDRPVAFFCAEFAIHPSLPFYAGGLGVLAGDLVKEASDRRLPFVGVGLLYRQGYFRQGIDAAGWQVERWNDLDPAHIAAAAVTGPDGAPISVEVPIGDRAVVLQIWRLDVGRVPLFLLDADRPENAPEDRAITSRLYVSDPAIRLRQYALLGFGGMRALRALGIDPRIVHLNEGHAAFAALDLPEGARSILTTHTPLAAGNEVFATDEVLDVVGGALEELGLEPADVLEAGRAADAGRFELTPFGIRSSAAASGVSRRHGQVARSMWQHLFPGVGEDDVPVAHVTNGVHLPSWIAPPVRAMLDRHLGHTWVERASDPDAWLGVDAIPDEEVWAIRAEARADLIAFLRDQGIVLDPSVLTVGFARRVAPYKRLNLIVHDPDRLGDLPLQVVLAGKAHPADDRGKQILRSVLAFAAEATGAARMAFVENYDLGVAAKLVAGCDVWVNLPTPPLEASGTSGMKAAINGALNLSVLDGWWDEAFDGTNGWAIESDPHLDPAKRDAADATALYDLLEREILPLYLDRDGAGIPRGWISRVKDSLRTIGPRFSATRMLNDYVSTFYR